MDIGKPVKRETVVPKVTPAQWPSPPTPREAPAAPSSPSREREPVPA